MRERCSAVVTRFQLTCCVCVVRWCAVVQCVLFASLLCKSDVSHFVVLCAPSDRKK